MDLKSLFTDYPERGGRELPTSLDSVTFNFNAGTFVFSPV
jgi:hypothetical protein